MSARVRPAEEADLPVLNDLAARTIDACYRPFLGDEAVEAFLGSGESDREVLRQFERTDVLEVEGRIVGVVVWFGDLLHLLMVDVDEHRNGYGTILLQHAEEEYSASGGGGFRLESFEGNRAARAFYDHHAWMLSSEALDGRSGVVRIYMTKQVTTTML